MPRPSTKRRTEEPSDNGSIFDHFSMTSKPDNSEDKKAVSTEDLLARLDALSSRLEEQEKTNLALMSRAPAVTYTPPSPQTLKQPEIPDPIDNPKEYAEWLKADTDARLNSFMQSQQEQVASVNKMREDADRLWEEFATTYSDYADDQDKVEFAVTQVVREANAKGMDVQRYMTVARPQFFKDVISKMDKVFGKPDQEQDDRYDGDDDTNRTAGIFGGRESAGRPTRGSNEGKTDMIKDLHDVQRKMGIF